MIPKDILSVSRPKNTVVQSTIHSNIYLVRSRKGYRNGKPLNGSVIGHIIDGKYIAKDDSLVSHQPKRLSMRDISYKYYGKVAFADLVGKELLDELKKQYAEGDALKIYICALLRASYGDIKDYQIADKYDKSFTSITYPNISLSKNTISNLLNNLGKDYKGIHDFMETRIKKYVTEQTRLLIDGMLKQNSSTVNTFSGFSYKGRIKGVEDISIICAVDAKSREPIAMKVYKGNLPDCSNYKDFLDDFKLENGLVIGDKGYPMDVLEKTFKDGKVGYIRPMKRNSKVSERLSLYDNYKILENADEKILCSKGQETDSEGNIRYYYCFQNISKASKEDSDYVMKAKRKRNFDIKEYQNKKKKFGTIVFVSNMDILPENVYAYYKLRWEIELVFKAYKSVLSQTTTREHDDYSVMGSEFINFLSLIVVIRMQNKVNENKDKIKRTYKEVDEALNDIIKASIDNNGGLWKTCTMNKEDKNLMSLLGI